MMGGSNQLASFSSDIHLGDLSSILIENLPTWANLMRTPNKQTTLLKEWSEKLYKMSIETINENVTNITGIPSWTLILLNNIFDCLLTSLSFTMVFSGSEITLNFSVT